MRKPFTFFRLYPNLKRPLIFPFLALLLLGMLTNSAYAQNGNGVTLSGTSYLETFDNIGSAIPTGWSSLTGATANSLGTSVTYVAAATAWSSTTGNFRNAASADVLSSTATSADQSASTDRAFAVRQTGAFGDPGAAFAVKVNNTLGFKDFQLSLKVQSLGGTSGPRSTTFTVQYGIGASPTAFTSLSSVVTGGNSFSSTTVSYNFGSTLDNIDNAVWIRVVALSTATGSGNRPLTGIDDFSLTYAPTAVGPAISVSPASLSTVSYIEGETVSTTASFTVSGSLLSPSVPVTVTPPPNFELSTDGTTFTPASLSFSPANDGTLRVPLYSRLVAGLTNGTYSGTISVGSSEVAGTKTVAVSGLVYSAAVVKIHDIQGTGASFDPAFGGYRRIEGIVTRNFAGSTKLNGFFVQEEDADADANPLTSEGIFVYDPAGLFTGSEGDKVKILGSITEYVTTSGANTSRLTELTNIVDLINYGASTLPTPVTVTLPVNSVSDLEAYESMLVTMSAASGNLTVTEYFQLGQYGQLVLSSTGTTDVAGTDPRLDQYTQYNTPSVAGYAAYLAELAKRKIIVDDASSVAYPDPIIFGRGGQPLSATNTLRGGDQVSSITTVLDERFEGYRLQSTTGINFQPTNVRPTTPPSVGGTLRVQSANVLNYFNGNGTGLDGSAGGFPTSRGATNLNEFTRQRTKVLANLYGSGADVIGLMEVENDGYGSASAIQDLVNGLNALAGATSYTFVNPGTSIATDLITVGMIYKPASVSIVGAPASLSTSAAFDTVGRRPLAVTFRQLSTKEVFTVVVNHWKSKGSSSGGGGDADINDGQGASNGIRTRQARALATWLNTRPTGTNDPDYLIIGDLNSYAKEDPVTAMANAGYNNLLPLTSYSYVFDGLVGTLDHALGTNSLASQVTGAEKWHINADEPSILDYNTENKSTAQQANLYSADQFRSSDHDPVIIGLNLVTPPDLAAILYATPSVQNGPGELSVVADIVELNSVASNGLITVKITKDAKVVLTFDGGANTVGARTVQNYAWTFNDTDPSYYELTTNQGVAAGNKLSFGLTGTLTPGATLGQLSVSAVILSGSGGETKVTNNSDAEKIDYFPQ